MNRIAQVFTQEPAFIGYLTAGHQGLETSFQAACALVEGGVNILEIGVPFSDPVADGPVIQQAMQDALQRQTTLQDVFELASRLRQRYPKLPLVLFSYFNPLLQSEFFPLSSSSRGTGSSPSRCLTAGSIIPSTIGPIDDENKARNNREAIFDGILVVDLPLEEGKDFLASCHKQGLAPIFVVTPDTTPERLEKINEQAEGFIYYACRKGTTGMKNTLPEDFSERIQNIKSHCQLPVAAGFGIASRESAKQVLQYADGFVVGSKFVKAIEDKEGMEALTQLARSLKP